MITRFYWLKIAHTVDDARMQKIYLLTDAMTCKQWMLVNYYKISNHIKNPINSKSDFSLLYKKITIPPRNTGCQRFTFHINNYFWEWFVCYFAWAILLSFFSLEFCKMKDTMLFNKKITCNVEFLELSLWIPILLNNYRTQ